VQTLKLLALLAALGFLSSPASAASDKLVKVLPHFIDRQGRIALNPSLYERDAYQAILRQHPERRSGIRFDVQWKARGTAAAPMRLRLELRGSPKTDPIQPIVLEQDIRPGGWFSHWIALPLTGEKYQAFGELTAWRATIWEGDRLLSEQKSFLW